MSAGVAVAVGVLGAAGLARHAVGAARGAEAARRLRPPVFGHPSSWSVLAGDRVQSWWDGRPTRRRRLVVDGLPSLLEEVARLLRSGASLRQALLTAPAATAGATAGPAGDGLAEAMARAERGVPLGDALAHWAAQEKLVEVRLTVAALELVAVAGGGAAQAIDSIAATLRERRAAAMDVEVQSAQARLSAAVIAALPVVFTLWCVATDDRAAAFLFASPAGWACLIGGAGLLACGAWWMGRIVRSVR